MSIRNLAETLRRLVSEFRREVCVVERGDEGLVAEDLLHGLQRHPFHHEPRRGRVPQVVEPKVFDRRFLEQRLPGALELNKAMASALALFAVVEDVGALDVAGDLLQGPCKHGVDRHVPRAAPFALVDRDDAAVQPADRPFAVPPPSIAS